MKVRDIISKMVDNYYKVIIEVFDHETNLIKERFTIKPHATNFTHIPEKVWETEVGMIVVHFDSLVIAVSDERSGNEKYKANHPRSLG